MEVFEIGNRYAEVYCYVTAENERQALCKYLMEHEELDDMMLWKSVSYPFNWKLAKYDNEEEYLVARKTYNF